MLENYLKITWRILWRNKLYSSVNVLGLAIGIATCLLTAVFIRFEKGYDDFHDRSLYRLCEITQKEGNGVPQKIARTMFPMGPALKAEFPEIADFVRIVSMDRVPLQRPGKEAVMGTWFGSDASFLAVFNFKLLKGNAARALEGPNSIILTEKMAVQLFGNEDPMGQIVRHQWRDTIDYTVTGVLQNVPHQSHLQFDAIYSLSAALVTEESTNWDNDWMTTYVKLKDNVDITKLEAGFPLLLQKYMGYERAAQYKLFLQSVRDIHLWSGSLTQDLLNKQKFNGSYLYLIAAVAFFVLILAVINYVNLTTASAITRVKEVGVRKINGAARRQIAGQFLAETMIFSFIALGLAFLLTGQAVPLINMLDDRKLEFNVWKEPFWIAVGSGIALCAGLAAGLLPAMFMAAIRPVNGLRKRLLTSSQSPLRNSMVVVQFTVAIGLSMATITAFRQLTFMQQFDPGFSKEEVIVSQVSWTTRSRVEKLMAQLRRLPGVQGVTGSLRRLGDPIDQNNIIFEPAGSTHEIQVTTMFVDYNYVPFYDIDMLAGRNISAEYVSDRGGNSYVVNKTLARKLLQYTDDPQAPINSLIGQKLRYTFQDEMGTIVGITDDFNFSSLHHSVEPLCLTYQHDYYFKDLSIRIDGRRRAEVISRIAQEWKSMLPDQQFDYYFLDAHLDELYKADMQAGRLMAVFTLLAILISCFGLVGLAVYNTERRVKEIGIRKVLGASVSSVMVLLSKDFLKLVLIAIVIATPLAWHAVDQWLTNFAYRIRLDWWVFLVAGLVALIIALVTVSFQSARAALMNPVKSLRSE